MRSRWTRSASALLVVAVGALAGCHDESATPTTSPALRPTEGQGPLAHAGTTVALPLRSDVSSPLPTTGHRTSTTSASRRQAGPAAQTSAPPGEGCGASGRSEGNVWLGNGGAGYQEDPSCSYDATRPGGYRATGRWRIEITRNGITSLFTERDAPPCGAVGVIQPGDRVVARVHAGATDPADWYVHVGPDAHC